MIETTTPGSAREDGARRLLTRVLASLALQPERAPELGRSMPSAVFVLDIQAGEVVYENGRVAELLGLDPARAAARREQDGFAARLHPEDAVRMFAELSRWDAREDSDVVESRFRLRHADGVYRLFLARTVLESRDEDGRAARVLGCAVQIEAPAGDDVEEPDPEGPGAEGRPGAGRDLGETVLVVDERPDILRVAARVLLDAGYWVLTATSAFEALAHDDGTLTAVTVLISEAQLPDLSGPELAARLHERGLDAPAIYMCSSPPDERFAELARGTRYTVLRKPFDPEALVRRVELTTAE